MMLEALSELVAKLPELKAEHERLGKLIAAIEAFAGPAEHGASSGTSQSQNRLPGSRPTIRADQYFGMSAPEATKAYLNLVGRGNPQGPRDIAKALIQGGFSTDEQSTYMNVSSALKRLRQAGEVVQIKRNQWGLASWYGGAGKRRENNRQKGEAADHQPEQYSEIKLELEDQ